VAWHILRPWAQLLVDAAAVAKGERVLDLACGTGLVARVAAQRVGPKGHVIGIDLNPAMIGVAQSLPPADIEWREGSALAIPLPDESVVVVLCQQGLQFFPDKALALREMQRVLVRGGRVALSVWSRGHLSASWTQTPPRASGLPAMRLARRRLRASLGRRGLTTSRFELAE
jgi:ubiquinone/menaquinone biosynthesis C-methylase UbiE